MNESTQAQVILPDSKGGLIVVVTTIRELYPVENARVTIFTGNAQNMQTVDFDSTDQSGRTKRFILDTPPKSLSLNSGNTQLPYSRYNILIEADGYISNLYYDVPVFSGITSIQSTNVMLSETAGVNKSPIIFNESQQFNLQ